MEEQPDSTSSFPDALQEEMTISSRSIQKVLDLAGAWSDLDWDDVERELYRIRHESKPTPPISI